MAVRSLRNNNPDNLRNAIKRDEFAMLMRGCVFVKNILLVPNGQQQFTDANGAPLANGSVYFYYPGTTSAKTTWQDEGGTTPNTDPVVLNAAGRAQCE